MPSFDVVSEINLQEVDNAVNQASKEIGTRYDFRGSKSSLTFDKEKKLIQIIADDDYKTKAIIDILQSKIHKRGIAINALQFGKIEDSGGSLKRCTVTLVMGIDQEKAKTIVQIIKDLKLKVQAQIQEEKVRVTGKSKDDLQDTMAFLKGQEFEIPLQFSNFRD